MISCIWYAAVPKFVLLCMIIILTGCKKLSSTTDVKSEHYRATLFDHLIAQAPGGKVPYPFSKLVSFLSQYGEPVGILIPLGRSLQRKAGYPEPFKDPRRLVAFDALPNMHGDFVEFDLHGRLFLGYVKKANAIEVISLLPDKNEFDFQIVSNYDKGKSARIENPEAEKQCKSCHQHGGPIFTPDPWDETNLDADIHQLLTHFQPKEHIDGIPVRQDFDNEITSGRFDDLVRRGSFFALEQQRWQSGCVQLQPVACSAQLLKNTLASLLFHWGPEHGFHSQLISPQMRVIDHPSDTINDTTNLQFLFSSKNLTGYQPSAEASELFNYLSAKLMGAKPITAQELQRMSLADLVQLRIIFSPPSDDGVFPPDRMLVADFFLSLALATAKPLRPQRLPDISPQQRQVVATELQKMLVHTHAKDSHLGTRLDPQQKRSGRAGVPWFLFIKSMFLRTKHIVRKAMLIDSNRRRLNPSYEMLFEKLSGSVITKNDDKTILFSFFLPNDRPVQGEKKISSCNTKQKNTLRCNFSTDDVSNYSGASSIKSLNFSFIGSREKPAGKAELSKLMLVTKRNHTYEVDLRCDLEHVSSLNGGVNYGCYPIDAWKLFEAIDTLVKDPSSFLHSPQLPQPVMVIKGILAKMGYTLQTRTEQINWLKAINAPDIPEDIHTPQTALGKKLASYCGDCHALDFFTAPFLYAKTQAQLCDNVRQYKDQMLAQLEDELMPPADYLLELENEKIRQFNSDRSHLIAVLRSGNFDFCGD